MSSALLEPGEVQVTTEHYRPEHYDELHRWVSYWYQIQATARAQPRSVLEVGVGSGVFSSYLRNRLRIPVTTFDFDASLQPDIAGDIRVLDLHVPPASFDAVVAFQVLEHLPFSDFAPALAQMARAARKSVIISLPCHGYMLGLRLRLWKWTWSFGRKISRRARWRFDGEHHWEIGTRGHSLRRVRAEIASVLEIERHYFCADYPYHYFFECRKR